MITYKTLAILTPSYNRANTLPRLYESLKAQTCFDFNWYIIDDGSSDNTEEICQSFISDKFNISYQKKENGGKHTALNFGYSLINEPLILIVDSDDYLSDYAVETIVSDWEKYGKDDTIGGLSYYKLFPNNSIIGDSYPGEDIIFDTYVNMRVNNHLMGDKAEVYRSDLLKKYKFPVFPNETFMSEAVVWNTISQAGYKLAFIPKGIYICEYLDGGLTSLGRKKLIQNPKGYVEHAKAHLHRDVKQAIQWKYTLMYIASAFFAGINPATSFKNCPKKMKYICAFPFGIALYLYWKRKHS